MTYSFGLICSLPKNCHWRDPSWNVPGACRWAHSPHCQSTHCPSMHQNCTDFLLWLARTLHLLLYHRGMKPSASMQKVPWCSVLPCRRRGSSLQIGYPVDPLPSKAPNQVLIEKMLLAQHPASHLRSPGLHWNSPASHGMATLSSSFHWPSSKPQVLGYRWSWVEVVFHQVSLSSSSWGTLTDFRFQVHVVHQFSL